MLGKLRRPRGSTSNMGLRMFVLKQVRALALMLDIRPLLFAIPLWSFKVVLSKSPRLMLPRRLPFSLRLFCFLGQRRHRTLGTFLRRGHLLR